MRHLQIILSALFLFALGMSFSQVTAQTEELTPPQLYLELDPSFVVNIEDGETVRFLQVNTTLQFSDQLAQPLIEKHLPAIRHAMVMILSGLPAKEIKTSKGKQDVQTVALQEVQKIMSETTGQPVIEAVYFTGFVIQ